MIPDFDVSACGGTHVARTGEIGVIKVVGWERRRKLIRVEFLSGSRALADYGAKNQVISRLSTMYTTGFWELENSVSRQQEALANSRRLLRRSRKKLMNYHVSELQAVRQSADEVDIMFHVFEDYPQKELRAMANQLVASDPVAALIASIADKTYLVFARHPEANGDMNAMLQEALSLLGSGSGGGSDFFAQGSSDVMVSDKVASVLKTVAAGVEIESRSK